MDLAPRSLRRLAPSIVAIGAALLAASLFLRCGSDKDEKKSPQQNPAPVPTSWDGQADWDQSAWKAVDE